MCECDGLFFCQILPIFFINLELKRSLYALFSQYGRILDVVALKTPKLRGQAWVVFSEVTASSMAIRQMQNFPFYDKPMVLLFHFKLYFLFSLSQEKYIFLIYISFWNEFIKFILYFFSFFQFIQYAKEKSDYIAKADGTFVVKEKRKKHDRGLIFLE